MMMILRNKFQVGHAVARHSAEGITKNMWLLILQVIFVLFVDGGASAELFSKLCNILLSLPFSRRYIYLLINDYVLYTSYPFLVILIRFY